MSQMNCSEALTRPPLIVMGILPGGPLQSQDTYSRAKMRASQIDHTFAEDDFHCSETGSYCDEENVKRQKYAFLCQC